MTLFNIGFIIVGVFKANEPNLLKKYGDHLELMDDWARHLIKSMDWVKRKGTTGKTEPSGKSLHEKVVLDHDIPLD